MGNYYMHYAFNLGIRMPDLGLPHFSIPKPVVYVSKVPYLRFKTPILLGRNCGTYGSETAGLCDLLI